MTDPTDAELRAEALKRFTEGGIHLPPEIADSMSLYDMGEAGLLDDVPEVHPDVARHYAESATADPMESIADDLTAKYLRTVLEAHGVPNPEAYRAGWCSPSENLQAIIDLGFGPRFLHGWWITPGVLDARYRQRQRNRRRRRR